MKTSSIQLIRNSVSV